MTTARTFHSTRLDCCAASFNTSLDRSAEQRARYAQDLALARLIAAPGQLSRWALPGKMARQAYKLLLLLMVVLCAGVAVGTPRQRLTTARVTGVIRDDAGGLLPNVVITFKTRKLLKKTVSRGDGSFDVDLPVSVYRVVAKADGCRDFKRAQMDARAGETIKLDITLKCRPTPIRIDAQAF